VRALSIDAKVQLLINFSRRSFGLAGELVISLNHFNAITIDAQKNAWIGAGTHLGDVALALSNQNRAMPHGTCPWVGFGGHVSFGGFGYSSRMWGFAMDNVLAVDVVLADGTIHFGLTREQDPDLFWVGTLAQTLCVRLLISC